MMGTTQELQLEAIPVTTTVQLDQAQSPEEHTPLL